MSKLIKNFTDLLIDGSKIADKKDLFKDFLTDNDEVLSSSSWGKLLKLMSEKAYVIKNKNEAYYFTLYTTYLNTFCEALEYYIIQENNFAVPCNSTIEFDYNEFDENKIESNSLKLYFDEVFKDFIEEEQQPKIQKYINNHLKYNYYKVLKNEALVLKEYIDFKKSELGIEEQNNFKKEISKKKIEQEFHEVVLDDKNGLTLADLYIEPYFRVHKKCFETTDERYKKIKSYQSKYIDVEDESIHIFIEDILNDKNKHNLNCTKVNTVFIAGQPGQGKSSFTKKFVNDIVNNKMDIDKDVVLIKLKDITEPTELLNRDIKDIVKLHIDFDIDDFNNYIFVFDGLDELAMKTGLTLNDIDRICQKLGRSELSILITTRHGYVNFDSLSDKNILIVELKELQKEQQIVWLENYRKTYENLKFTKEVIENIYKEDKSKHIIELINQPILLHMIASMDIDDFSNLTKTKLYENFFDILIKRNWEKTQHPLSDGIDEDDYKESLKNMLKELAFNIYNSNFEYIHKTEFEKLDSVKELQELLIEHSNNESLKTNLKGIMISFYFKEIKKEDEDENIEERNEKYAIEFLHKSLMEYMVALNIYDNIFQDFLAKKNNSRAFAINDGETALRNLWQIFYKKELSFEVLRNLKDLIDLNNNEDEKNLLVERLENFFSYFVEKDFLYDLDLKDNFPLDKSKNVLNGFWSFLNCLSPKNNLITLVTEKERFVANLMSGKNRILDFSNQDLSNIRINNLHLAKNSNNINFENSFLYKLDISRVSIKNFEFYFDDYNTKFDGKMLENASSIVNCNIYETEFKDYNFEYKDFYNNRFEYCIFKNVTFKCGINLHNIFIHCQFINCKDIHLKEFGDINSFYFIHCTHNGKKLRNKSN